MLGRITEAEMSNPVHDDDAFAPMIMRNGTIPYWSGDVDIERAIVDVVAVIDTATGKRVPIRRNPPSGTAINPADQAAIDQFSNEPVHKLVLGHIPNSGGLTASVVNRHFGPMNNQDGSDAGGYGEARHIGIFGQNGSAKTVMLTTMIAGRLAAHPQMGLLMPDTSGDLADPTRHGRGEFRWDYMEVLRNARNASVEIECIPINDIRLTSTDTLKHKLKPFMNKQFNVGHQPAEHWPASSSMPCSATIPSMSISSPQRP